MTKREAWILRGFLALGAALTALTLIFPQVGMLEWVTMIPIALALYRLTDRGVSLWKAYRYGFFTVFVFYSFCITGSFTFTRWILSGSETARRLRSSLRAGSG